MRHHQPYLAAAALFLVAPAWAVACTNVAHTQAGDPSVPLEGGASPLGSGARLRNIIPTGPSHPAYNQNVTVTGTAFIVKDDFDETADGKSANAIYVEDEPVNSPDAGDGGLVVLPYSGMQLYKSTFFPPSLQLAPGDVVDFTGQYEDYPGPNSSTTGMPLFPTGQTQPEFSKPIVSFLFEYKVPDPVPIKVEWLTNYTQAYPYMSMLVTLQNVTIGGVAANPKPRGDGRNTVFITSDTSLNAPTMDNELFDLGCPIATCTTQGFAATWPTGAVLKSVTGIVTYFINFHISPRSMDDIVFENPPDAGADGN